MSAHDDGGPAYPSRLPKNRDQHLLDNINSGMTLRDWFAGQALPACISSPCAPAWTHGSAEHHSQSAAAAYLMADAMLAARNNLP